MSGFSEDEIAAEMNRRRDAIRYLDAEHLENMRRAERNECDTVCLSCATPVKSYLVSDPKYPLCETCLGD
ncbi:hypothetical protein J2766_003409 [Agrobacterium tumefaciens]|uniref:DksA C4-type domain-containing protein n=1 Tax=Agrobacterium tumefaciens TaxID=358 RepID=A0AAW8LQ02_AGRTU|nr:hypothetical protein [Agrobacterium tumefaciens]MDR6700729.1 hypothetical protein [Agrobacterium tumefaciens]